MEFDVEMGVYRFELGDFKTQLHAHPAIEIILAVKGKFVLETNGKTYANIGFAIIDANVSHKVISEKCEVKILMLEYKPALLHAFLLQHDIQLINGIFLNQATSKEVELFNQLLQLSSRSALLKTDNKRIQACLDYFNQEGLEYKQMLQLLKSKVHLSESRLSHLFKEEMGISLKKYLVWSRLKKAIQLVIKEKINLYDAAMRSGFYDQAHLSKAFKEMLGLSPSEVYNSRMLQD